jgi:nucleoside-diphosphate-sugar epimerase
MNLSQIIRDDNAEICSDSNIPWGNLRGTTILVTGATGVIGSAVVRALSFASHSNTNTNPLGLKIIALGRDVSKKAILGEHGYEFVSCDLRTPPFIDCDIDYIIHCAGMRRSKDLVSKPVDVIETSVLGTLNMLKLAEQKQIKGMVFVSSMEVYGQTSTSLDTVGETDLGYVDLENIRSCYPESRRMCEGFCNAFYAQYGVPVNSARLCQTFGAGSSIDDPIAAISFGKNAYYGNDIILHTIGKSISNFCYISDAVRALLTILLNVKSGTAYNVSNPEASMTIRQFAEIIAHNVCKDKIKVKIEIPADIEKRGYAGESRTILSAEKLISLGWTPTRSIEEMYERLFVYWREIYE